MKHLILVLSIFTIVACTNTEEESNSFLDCDEISENFKVYQGEEIECQFHYVPTEYNDQQFIELRAHCADLTRSYVINENCEDICKDAPYDTNSECGKYLENKKDIEIAFIAK